MSPGQKIFAIAFIILFVVGIGFAYRSDFKKRKSEFKGTWVTFALIFGVVLLFMMIRYVFKQLNP